MGSDLKESDFEGFTVRSVIAVSSKALLFVKTDIFSGKVTYWVESKEYDIPIIHYSLVNAIETYNKLCK